MGLGGSWEGLGTILEGSCEVLGASWCDMSVLDGPRADFGIERALPVRLTHTQTRTNLRCETKRAHPLLVRTLWAGTPPPGSPREAPQEPRGGGPGTQAPMCAFYIH